MRRLAKYLPALMLSLPFTAQAEFVNLMAELNGAAEVPPVTTPATGAAAMVLDDVTGDFTWNIMFSGLSSPLAALHFHNAPVGVNGPIVLGLFDSNPANITSGILNSQDIAADRLSGTFMGMATLSADAVDAILDDLATPDFDNDWYINIHSENFPGGEIRGQLFQGIVAPIPLPAALYLFASGLGLLAFLKRRRAQA